MFGLFFDTIKNYLFKSKLFEEEKNLNDNKFNYLNNSIINNGCLNIIQNNTYNIYDTNDVLIKKIVENNIKKDNMESKEF